MRYCPEKARKPDTLNWWISNASSGDLSFHTIFWHCKTCGLGYNYQFAPIQAIHIPKFGTFSEPPDAIELLALVGA